MKRSVLLLTLFILVLGSFGGALAQETPVPGDDPADGEVTIDIDEAAQDTVTAAESAAETTVESIGDLLDRLGTVPENDIARVMLVVGGLILLVAGWRIYEFIILISGLIVGASVAVDAVAGEALAVQLVALVIGGIVGALLGVFLYYLAVFFTGVYVGIGITNALGEALDLTPVTDLALLIGGIIGGVILLALATELLIVYAAIVGAQLLVLGLGLDPVWILIFAIAGVVLQVVASRQTGRKIRRRPRSLWRRS